MPTASLPTLADLAPQLPAHLHALLRPDEPLAQYTTLRVGGPADLFFAARTRDDLAEITLAAQRLGLPYFLLGGGSNLLVSDRGIRGLVVQNLASDCSVGPVTNVDTGHSFMELFLKSLSAGLGGLEFAVGIPGSVGGALVSNAGAYRENICDRIVSLDVTTEGERIRVGPDWMEFSYRDSRLRNPLKPTATLLGAELQLVPKPRREILALARENQRQRIFKQPWYPSAGSFFKNVVSRELAERLPELPEGMRAAGVVPAGYLSAACGCKGLTIGGAQVSHRHANIVVNRGNATAQEVRQVTLEVKRRVLEKFGIELEEEVLCVGDWS